MKSMIPILFALGTACCWGLYGPTIANARSSTGAWSPFKPYVFIGVAYLVWACGGGLLGMVVKRDVMSYAGDYSQAMNWGFIAGSFGAVGAFSLTSAMLSGGKPYYVMPIVFGGAVTITAIVSLFQQRDWSQIHPMLYVGMVTVVVGIVLVAAFTPHGHGPKKKTASAETEQHVESSAETAPPAE